MQDADVLFYILIWPIHTCIAYTITIIDTAPIEMLRFCVTDGPANMVPTVVPHLTLDTNFEKFCQFALF